MRALFVRAGLAVAVLFAISCGGGQSASSAPSNRLAPPPDAAIVSCYPYVMGDAAGHLVVVRFGRRFGVAKYVACWLAALAVPVALALSRRAPWMLLPLLTLPLGVALARKVATLEGRPLNPVLGATAGALLLHSLLTTVGLLVG